MRYDLNDFDSKEPLSVDPVEIPEETIVELEPVGGVTPKLSDPDLSRRAFIAQYGLESIINKSYEDIYRGLAAGEEDYLRQEAASQLNSRKQLAAEQAIAELAKNKGAKLTPEEAEGMRGLIMQLKADTNPDTVFEEAYGKRYLTVLDEVANRNPDSMWNDIKAANPALAAKLTDTGSWNVTKRAIVTKMLQNMIAEAKTQGWIPYLFDAAKNLSGVYEYLKLRNNIKSGEDWTPFLGENLQQQRRALFQLSVEDGSFVQELERVVNYIKHDNPSMAVEFLKAMQGMDDAESTVKSSGVIFDFIGLPLISGTKKLIQGTKNMITGANKLTPANVSAEQMVKDATKAVDDVVKSSAIPDPTKATILEGAGDVGETAIVKATSTAVAERLSTGDPTQTAVQALFTAWRQDETDFLANMGNASRELVTRILDESLTIRNNLEKAIVDSQKVERLPEVFATEKAIRGIKHSIEDSLQGIRNTVLDIPKILHEPVANVRYAEIHLGKPGAELFPRRSVAEQFRKVHGLLDATIEQRGQGFYLKLYRPLNETADAVRDNLAKTASTQMPESLVSSWIGKFRTSEDTTSLAQRQNAKIATYAPSIAYGILQENAKALKKLKGWNGYRNEKWQDLIDVMKAAQDFNSGEGTFFKGVADFQDFFKRAKGFDADEQQVAAYFAFKRGMEIDRIYRNIAEHRFKSRVGTITNRIYATSPDGSRIWSPEFEGVPLKQAPGGTDLILLVNKYGKERIVTRSELGKDWDAINKAVKEGRSKAFELYDPERRPFSGFGSVADERIRYVISEGAESQSLKWNHIPRRGGGHIEYDYQFYIKQPKVIHEARPDGSTRKIYEGDTTIMPIAIRQMGVDVAKHLDEVRKLILDNKMNEARNYSNNNLHIDWKTVGGWFKSKKTPDGKTIPPRLNKHETILVVERGQSSNKVSNELNIKYGDDFMDGTTQGSLARQYQVQYTEARDSEKLFTLDNVGTKDKPLYQIADVDKVDPISTMNRALNRIATSNYLDDYKISAIEHWIEQAAPYLKAPDVGALRYSPYKYFNDPQFLNNTPPDVQRELMTVHAAIQELVGKPSMIDNMVDAAINRAVDSVYKRAGIKSARITSAFLARTSDPIMFARGVAFHTKLGLANVAQFFAQSMTYVNIAALAPRYAVSGTYAAQLHFWSTLNGRKPILDHLDDMATKLNLPGQSKYKPGEFREAVEEAEKTGFLNVGGEHSALDNPYSNKVINTAFGQILDSGTVFFRYGERNSKLGAWHVAFKEFRDKNPTGRITDVERAQILERADLLNMNMSRASNSQLHTGILSIPLQFYTYQLRVMELFWSRRITKADKMRLAGVNSAMFGIPVGLGVTGAPVSDSDIPFVGNLRMFAKEHGYTVGENFLSSIALEGIPAYLTFMATGKAYNFGDRWGSKGLESWNTFIRGDKHIIETLGGASGGIFKSVWEATDGFSAILGSMYRDDDKLFPVTGKDAMAILKEVSTVNSVDSLWTTLNTGKMFTKSGEFLTEASTLDAFVKFFTGLQDQDASDTQRFIRSNQDLDKRYQRAEKLFMTEWRAGLRAEDSNNPEQAKRYFTRANAYLKIYGYPEEKMSTLLERASKDNESLISRLKFEWAIRKAPTEKKDAREDWYRKQLQKEEERK